jgi:nicotinate-nucleotide pyrophosphorylase (carboxylating)
MIVDDKIHEALQEDIGRGDLFSLVSDNRVITADIISKEDGVLAGMVYLEALCKKGGFEYQLFKKDGEQIKYGDLIATIKGASNNLLMYERTMLNFLMHGSGIATNTNRFVQKLQGYNTKLLDTRKTRPGLRVFEKYAVRCGGGNNHRLGLDDCLMIKDTHLGAIDNLKKFIDSARKKIPYTSKIEIECESVEDAKYAMRCGADLIMCDNMKVEEIMQVVKYKFKNYPHILIEASGNITLETIEKYARTGVNAVSSGSLIHKAVWLDFSMRTRRE